MKHVGIRVCTWVGEREGGGGFNQKDHLPDGLNCQRCFPPVGRSHVAQEGGLDLVCPDVVHV